MIQPFVKLNWELQYFFVGRQNKDVLDRFNVSILYKIYKSSFCEYISLLYEKYIVIIIIVKFLYKTSKCCYTQQDEYNFMLSYYISNIQQILYLLVNLIATFNSNIFIREQQVVSF
eukprot:TRINITY_DN16236_c0_g1_i8.p13 TRINITY_DN16236_c0_g1~~TRINITY_DN16236_c0_g1_i8.p13  ORF type:complete len:116 (-),score=0.39 TRINITY_DN16236_c0_g1_i8:3190-3537(-)